MSFTVLSFPQEESMEIKLALNEKHAKKSNMSSLFAEEEINIKDRISSKVAGSILIREFNPELKNRVVK